MNEELRFWGKFKKKMGGGVEGGGGRVWGGQDGCERSIKVFVKIKKKNIFWGGVRGGWGRGQPGGGGQGGCE